MAEPTLYLFDGFNLLHAGGFESTDALRDLLAGWVATKGARGVLVFDGHGADAEHGPLSVRWAPDADALIERLAAEHRARRAGRRRLVRRGGARNVGRRGAQDVVADVPRGAAPAGARRPRARATCATGSTPRRSRGSSGCGAARARGVEPPRRTLRGDRDAERGRAPRPAEGVVPPAARPRRAAGRRLCRRPRPRRSPDRDPDRQLRAAPAEARRAAAHASRPARRAGRRDAADRARLRRRRRALGAALAEGGAARGRLRPAREHPLRSSRTSGSSSRSC